MKSLEPTGIFVPKPVLNKASNYDTNFNIK